MTSWRDVPSDVLEQEWATALAADVGSHMPHADLGRRLVELAAEIDRRVLAGESGLIHAPTVSAPAPRSITPSLMDTAWLTTYLTRGALSAAARPGRRSAGAPLATPGPAA
ncbi:hypothetical protein [Georgenia wangjunii]|uniref:hypothetical protein n=1 Tax=Georgenia wangjunii TaxID=3117730 RepID=UPI002F267C4A